MFWKGNRLQIIQEKEICMVLYHLVRPLCVVVCLELSGKVLHDLVCSYSIV